MMLAYAFAFLIYGNVQEDFYVPALTILFFVTFGIFVQAVPSSFTVSRRVQQTLGVLLALSFGGHLTWEYGQPGVTRIAAAQNEMGCYDDLGETPESTTMWCGPSFRLKRPVLWINGEPHAFVRLSYEQEDPNLMGLTMKVQGNQRTLPILSLPKGPFQWVDLTLPKECASDTVRLLFEAKESFVPARDYLSGSGDIRRLSVQKSYEQRPALFNPAGPANCSTSPQRGGALWLACETGGVVPLPYEVIDPEKLSISLPWSSTASNEPLWILMEEAKDSYRIIRIPDVRWHSFAEIGAPLAPGQPLSIRVVTHYPQNPEPLPFALAIKP
jgi:hypothetical protein